jgi:hypothetical protein
MEEYKQIQEAVNSILNIQSFIKRKAQRGGIEKKREIFVMIINMIDEAIVRSNIAYSDLEIDTAKYDEKFYSIIDYLLLMSYGPECYDLISFYLWERMDEDGNSLALVDTFGNHIEFKSPYDLWDLMIKINPKINK